MLRYGLAALVALGLSAGPLFAEDATFTVTAASADVYKSPSTGSPIIGRVVRGASVPVTRELGSWVRIVWPDAEDGAGFLHVSMGRVVNGAPAETVRAAAGAAVRASAEVPPAEYGSAAPVGRARVATPVPHMLGLGPGLVAGSPLGFGATARAWRQNRLGLRVDVSRYAMGTPPARVSSLQVEPSVLFALADFIGNYFWLRPYVGSGISLRHQTVGDDRVGFQAFGGGELTHASAPQLAISADFGYRSRRSPADTFDLGGFGVSLSAHWYVR